MAHLLTRGPFPMDVGPLQHDDIDIGDDAPVRCLKNGLWFGAVHVEMAVPSGERGAEFSRELFRDIERRVATGRAYRGRVISLESYYDPTGRGGAVKVHRLHSV